MMISKYMATARMAVQEKTNGGVLYMFPDMIMKIVYLVPVMFIWRSLAENGYEVELSVSQLMTYTYVNALLTDMMIVNTFLSAWDYDTRSMEMFTRPIPVFGQVIARTVGEWMPMFLLFSLPMFLAASLFKIRVMPETLWVIPSLVLSVSLGFAFEILFYCVTVRLRNVSWLTYVIRNAVVSFFSGTVIPFKILPFGMDRWISYQPFGSLGGAFLSLYVGSAEALEIIPVQFFWNIVTWLAAVIWFRRYRERMVSFGG
ncbi:MAG: hypothetical protein HDR17_05225 [Lachnospiraceae bacterium]|nr:hypothetical protein [Lachnospiraceae bacterium]